MAGFKTIITLLACAFPWLAGGQDPSYDPASAGESLAIHVDVDLVVLHATVVDGKGRSVRGLAQDNFEVLDNGREQSISVFSDEDVPVTVGLVVDNSGSMAGKKDSVLSAARAFAHASNPRDEMFLVHFNEYVGYGLPPGKLFAGGVQELEDAFSGFMPRGRTALYDAIAKALRHLERGQYDKKVLLVVSDGGDNSSSITFSDVLQLADRSAAAIYTIGLFDEYADDKNPGVIKRLARATGGKAYLPGDISEVVTICERIARDIRTQYMLGYFVEDAHDGETYHRVKMTASSPNHKKLRVRTREGYYRDLATPGQ